MIGSTSGEETFSQSVYPVDPVYLWLSFFVSTFFGPVTRVIFNNEYHDNDLPSGTKFVTREL